MISISNEYFKLFLNKNVLINENVTEINYSCKKCGTLNQDGSKFCSNCGESLLLNNDSCFICDSLDEIDQQKKILKTSKSNIFVSSGSIGSIQEDYEDFKYYIGFGYAAYEFMNREFAFEISKSFNGFIKDQELEDSYEDLELDILFVFPNNHSIPDIRNRLLLPILDLSCLFKAFGKELKIGINCEQKNINFSSVFTENIKNEYRSDISSLEETYNNLMFLPSLVPNKYLETSRVIVFVDPLDSRIFYADFIKKKSFFFSSTDDLLMKKFINDKLLQQSYSSLYSSRYFRRIFSSFISKNKNYNDFINQFYAFYEDKNAIINSYNSSLWRAGVIDRFINLINNPVIDKKILDVSLDVKTVLLNII